MDIDNSQLIITMEDKRISKFLSLVLRHKPEVIDLKVDEEGWASIDELIQRMQQKTIPLDRKRLHKIVKEDNKQRYCMDESMDRIRANQGHSIPVNLKLSPILPPPKLFHGTAQRFVDSIMEFGLLKMGRNQVHLSADLDTAINVGKRHGKPTVLEIDATWMNKTGFKFFLSENKVWLTEEVPPKYIKVV